MKIMLCDGLMFHAKVRSATEGPTKKTKLFYTEIVMKCSSELGYMTNTG